MKAAFFTFGCKVNQYETQALIALFEKSGFQTAAAGEACDVYIVNSCTVTGEGDNKTRKLLRRLRREHPHAVLALTGCYAQAVPNVASLVPEADVITGSKERAQLVRLVNEALALGKRVVSIAPHLPGEPFEPMAVERFSGRTRAFLKIQDGCERRCAYCIIPTARGPFRSKPLCDIKAELTALALGGYREVVLVGINLSTFGIERGERLLAAVSLACSIEGIERVRLSSLEPELLSRRDIADLSALKKFCPQFHLSLQSGCDDTLLRMRRHYTAAQYQALVADIRMAFSNPAITTDIMVGFPGESEAEFSRSLAFAEKIGFAKMHVFSYSRRPGTAADEMEHQVPEQTKARRSREMLAAAARGRKAFLHTQVGTNALVLFESEKSGVYTGYSENYTPVRFLADENLCGRLLLVRIVGAQDDCCTCELLP